MKMLLMVKSRWRRCWRVAVFVKSIIFGITVLQSSCFLVCFFQRCNERWRFEDIDVLYFWCDMIWYDCIMCIFRHQIYARIFLVWAFVSDKCTRLFHESANTKFGKKLHQHHLLFFRSVDMTFGDPWIILKPIDRDLCNNPTSFTLKMFSSSISEVMAKTSNRPSEKDHIPSFCLLQNLRWIWFGLCSLLFLFQFRTKTGIRALAVKNVLLSFKRLYASCFVKKWSLQMFNILFVVTVKICVWICSVINIIY